MVGREVEIKKKDKKKNFGKVESAFLLTSSLKKHVFSN